jgi:hypothetical protein
VPATDHVDQADDLKGHFMTMPKSAPAAGAKRHRLPGALLIGTLLVPATLLTAGPIPAIAQSAGQTVTLEGLSFPGSSGQTIAISRIDVVGTNLSRAEVETLFKSGAAKTEVLPIITKMRADRLTIAGVSVTGGKDGQRVTVRPIELTGIDAGKAATLRLAGMEGGDNTGVAFNLRALSGEGLDVARALQLMKDTPLGGPRGIKLARMAWEGGTFQFPDKDTKADAPGGNLVKMSFGPMAGTNDYAGDTLNRSVFSLKNMVIEGPPSSQFGQQLKALGYDKVDLSLDSDGSYNAAARTMKVDRFTLTGQGMGALDLKFDMTDVGEGIASGVPMQSTEALMQSSIRSLTLSFVNDRLFQNAFAFAAMQQGKQPAAMIQEMKALATGMLPMMLGGDQGVLKVATAIGQFMDNPRSISITASGRNGPVKVMDLQGLKNPADAMRLIALDATAN